MRVVEALTIGSVTGIMLATAAYLVVNRLLPLGASLMGQDRAALEVWVFYLVWLATFLHAACRGSRTAPHPSCRAWQEQCWCIAALAMLAVLLNGWSTGDHLAATLARGDLQVAGVDLMLLASAGVAAWAAWRLRRATGLRKAPGSKHASPADAPQGEQQHA